MGKEWAELSPEEFDQGWIDYFSNESLDDWELRRGINILYGQDAIPDPKIVVAVLRAARRQNDVATAIRFLEAVNEKTAGNRKIYSYILQVIGLITQQNSLLVNNREGFVVAVEMDA